MLGDGTGLEGNSRGNPVMGHDLWVGQAPDQANEGGQAGASNAEDRSLVSHAPKRSGSVRATGIAATNLASPPGGYVDTHRISARARHPTSCPGTSPTSRGTI